MRKIFLMRIFQTRRREKECGADGISFGVKDAMICERITHVRIRKQNDAARLCPYLTVHYAVSDLRCLLRSIQSTN